MKKNMHISFSIGFSFRLTNHRISAQQKAVYRQAVQKGVICHLFIHLSFFDSLD
jgi:hypothetical protein